MGRFTRSLDNLFWLKARHCLSSTTNEEDDRRSTNHFFCHWRSPRPRGPSSATQDAAIERLQYAIANDGNDPPHISAVIAVALAETQVAGRHEIIPEQALREIQEYVDRLPEPQKTMLMLTLDEMRPSQIAESMGLENETVIRSLANVYAELRMLMAH